MNAGEFAIGDRVFWMSPDGDSGFGTVIDIAGDTITLRMDDGRCVDVLPGDLMHDYVHTYAECPSIN